MKTGKWHNLPLDANIDLFLYGFKDNNRDIEGHTKKLPKDITTGIYYVRDRFAENYHYFNYSQ